MKAIRHRLKGTAQIIEKDDNFITIQYDCDGSVSKLKFPDGLTSEIFVLDEDLRSEVNAVLEARKKAKRIEVEAKWAMSESKKDTEKVSVNGKKRSGKTFVGIKRTGDIEKDFEHFLKVNDYSEETKNGTKSTIYSYVNAVKSVLEDEGLDWTDLMKQIASVIHIYDVGGAKEEIGYKGNHTVINALRRFENYVNNSTP